MTNHDLTFFVVFLIQFIAHEIGHNLGMSHDFLGDPEKPRVDSKNVSCSGVNGIMDYAGNSTQWSTCSVEDLTAYVAANQPFCLKTVDA